MGFKRPPMLLRRRGFSNDDVDDDSLREVGEEMISLVGRQAGMQVGRQILAKQGNIFDVLGSVVALFSHSRTIVRTHW